MHLWKIVDCLIPLFEHINDILQLQHFDLWILPSVHLYKSQKKNLGRGYDTPEPPSTFRSPANQEWYSSSKTLDYTFTDDNTAILTPKLGGARQKQKVDAQAYCRQILASRGGMKKNGLSSSAGHLAIDTEQLLLKKDVTKSPGFRREKQMDKQRKKLLEEEDEKFVKKEEDDHKSSFWQC